MSHLYYLIYKLLRTANSLIHKLQQFHEILWLGIINKSLADKIDIRYYNDTFKYSQKQYNLQGLFEWEKTVVEQYYSKCKKILIGGAGGGREIVALSKLGYDVTGFESNAHLVEFGNILLKEVGIYKSIKLTKRDCCPDNNEQYDGIILGWGMYMLIPGKERRITLLKNLRNKIPPDSPILLSFFSRKEEINIFGKITKHANFIRKLFRKQPLQTGDRLQPNLVHYFTENELRNELEAGGFRLVDYSTMSYPHAVAEAA